MKILTLITLLFVSTFVGAQSFSLSLPGGSALTHGDIITVSSTDADVTYSTNIWLNNTSNDAKLVKVKRTVLIEVNGSLNYFCFGQCFPPDTSRIFVSPDSLEVVGKSSEKGFTADYESHGNAGKTTILYTFYDINNANDSISVVLEFVAGSGLGISQTNSQLYTKVYPNPASNLINLTYSSENANNTFELRNIIGQIVKQETFSSASIKTQIDISQLPNGVYFYQIVSNGIKSESKKLIIQH